MKIFSSFDTDFKKEILRKAEQEYGKDNVMVVTHGRFFYYFTVLLPASLIWLLAVIYWVVGLYLNVFFTSVSGFYWWFIFILFVVIFLPIGFSLLKKYIDCILDFVIVTPDKLVYYNQEWVFSRKGRTIDAEKIKAITVNKTGILRSIFNFWNIVILTEWDETWEGEINFKFVDDPDRVKFKILEIIHAKNKIS